MSGSGVQEDDLINGVPQGNALRPHHVNGGNGRLAAGVPLHPIKQGCMITIEKSDYLRFNHPEQARLMKPGLPLHGTPVQYHQNDHGSTGYMNHQKDQHQCYQTNVQKMYKDTPLSQLDEELDITLKEMSRKKPPVAPRKPYRDLDYSDSNSDQESRPKVSSIMAKVSKFEYYAKQQKNTSKSQFYTNNENEISPKVFSSNSLTVNTPAKDVLGGKSLPNYMNKMRQEAKIVQLSENNIIDPKSCSYANVAIRNKTKIDEIVRNFDENRLPKKVNNEQQSKDNIYGKINADPRNNFESVTQNFDVRNNYSYPQIDARNNFYNNTNKIFNERNAFEKKSQNIDDRTRLEDATKNYDSRINYNRQQLHLLNLNERNNVDTRTLEDSKSNSEPRIVEAEMKNELYGMVIDRPVNSPNTVKPLTMPSPAFDRNPQYSPVYANYQFDRSVEAENKRMQAYQERIKEEEQKEAEAVRLEEILNMCAEYERQISSGLPITPTEKRPHNKIITNGSLPRSVALNNPNFVQTSDGYYKFETSQNSRSPSLNQPSPAQRNVSHYENLQLTSLGDDVTHTPTVTSHSVGRMDEIGIPVFESPKHELSSPIMIRKLQNGNSNNSYTPSPVGSPYENVYGNRNMSFKPKSPNTQSPRTRIKTTFAHKNLPSPQYFVFPTPPPVDNSKKPSFVIPNACTNQDNGFDKNNSEANKDINVKSYPQSPVENKANNKAEKDTKETYKQEADMNKEVMVRRSEKVGIEKQLSLEEEIPMIDDSDLTDDIEFRYAKKTEDDVDEKKVTEKDAESNRQSVTESISLVEGKEMETSLRNDTAENNRLSLKDDLREYKDTKEDITLTESIIEKRNSLKDDLTETLAFLQQEKESQRKLSKNQSFDDVKKELMADIPELEEFEKDLKENRREKMIKNITDGIKKMDVEADSIDSILEDNIEELRSKYEKLRDERKKLMTDIHEIKCKMTEIRSQEDDILRELEMEKALIKGEYDSEIAILNIELKKRTELMEQAKKLEEDIRCMKQRQEARQNEMRDRVEIATLKVERIENDLKMNAATMEELQNARDILDNETKTSEDLEFQYLEEESELLSNREDIQQEINLLTKKLEAQKTRILTLKSEANDNLTSALDETKILHAEYVRLLNRVEDMTVKVQALEKELKPIANKLNDIERTQSPDSAFYTDQTRAKSGEYGYSPQSSDSDDLDLAKISNFEDHTKEIKDKFNSIDRMSQSMIVDIERRVLNDAIEPESPSKSSTSKEKKGFWERNFDSLKRKKKPKSPEKTDIMSQSLNENIFYNNETIETDPSFDKFNSLRHSKKKDKNVGPVKSHSSSKIPTFAALGKIIKKDSFGKKSRENSVTKETSPESNEGSNKNRYVKNSNKTSTDNKYKSKSQSPDKANEQTIKEENEDVDAKQNQSMFDFTNSKDFGKVLYRKSCGDEPNMKTNISEFQKMSDSGKIPSQDDIDRISKVTMDAPLFPSDTDMNSLGKRTLDSLMEIERKRMEMLEEQGCQVIENEREKISELKRRAQDETKKLWDQKYREQSKSLDSDHVTLPDFDSNAANSPNDRSAVKVTATDITADRSAVNPVDRGVEDSMLDHSFDMTSSGIFEDSSGLMSSSIEELQVRNSRSEWTEDERRSDDSRPLSHASDFTRESILSGGRRRPRALCDSQRPLTRYLPNDRDDFDLRIHVESAGHQIELCPYVTVTSTSCRGYLHKLGAKFHTWSKRWFVFDRESKTFVYYWDKSEKKPRGGAYFQVIEEVYLDHGNTSKSPSPQTTFIVKTRQRRYYLMAPSGESARIWIDVIFTGAQGYTEYLE